MIWQPMGILDICLFEIKTLNLNYEILSIQLQMATRDPLICFSDSWPWWADPSFEAWSGQLHPCREA